MRIVTDYSLRTTTYSPLCTLDRLSLNPNVA